QGDDPERSQGRRGDAAPDVHRRRGKHEDREAHGPRRDAALVTTLDARTGAAATLAGGEAPGAVDGRLEGLGPRPGLERQGLGERQAEALDRRASIGEHGLLWEGREA